MTGESSTATTHPLSTIGTALSRARCRQPARIDRMKQSLSAHGQLTPLVAVTKPEGTELIDGFKRHAAAKMLGWEALLVTVKPFDEMSQWTAMLLLNRGQQSMTTMEEALVLRELLMTGLTQIEIAALVERHKTWVSRRIGLVDRLHPELVEAMKLGLLHPGVARRLLSLPPGNQLEMAAAAQSARLGPRDTELLVSLWRRTKDASAKRALLSEPRSSLAKHHPETQKQPKDLQLTPEGQRLAESLHRLQRAVAQTSMLLRKAPSVQDLRFLAKELRNTVQSASRITSELGSLVSASSAEESGESAETC
jgi:ParB/RepB/Spo0J family partition protein